MEPFIKKFADFFLLSLAVPLGILGIILFRVINGLHVPSLLLEIEGFITAIMGGTAIIVAFILRMEEEEET